MTRSDVGGRQATTRIQAARMSALALAWMTMRAATAANAATTVITADRMLDVRSGRMIERPQLVVRDGRIETVGRAGDSAPADAQRIELPGMTLLPGLIDMHVHLD